MSEKKEPKKQLSEKEIRKKKLEEKLRANLSKRKQQLRERS